MPAWAQCYEELPVSAFTEFLPAGNLWGAGDAPTREGLSSPAPAGLYISASILGINVIIDILMYINFPGKVRAALFFGKLWQHRRLI